MIAAVPCCLCGSTDVAQRYVRDGIRVGPCASCGLVRTADVPSDYERLYTTGTLYHGQNGTKTPYVARYKHDLAVAALRLPRHLERLRASVTGTLIDVGCANGAFVAHAASTGWKAAGIEPNAIMADWAEKTTGAKVYTVWPKVEHIDMVTYHDVIEHVLSPLEELRRAHRALHIDGLLVVDTPDGETLDRVGAHHLKPREHLWFFSEAQLRALLELTGYDVIDVERPIPGKLVAYASPHYEGP